MRKLNQACLIAGILSAIVGTSFADTALYTYVGGNPHDKSNPQAKLTRCEVQIDHTLANCRLTGDFPARFYPSHATVVNNEFAYVYQSDGFESSAPVFVCDIQDNGDLTSCKSAANFNVWDTLTVAMRNLPNQTN